MPKCRPNNPWETAAGKVASIEITSYLLCFDGMNIGRKKSMESIEFVYCFYYDHAEIICLSFTMVISMSPLCKSAMRVFLEVRKAESCLIGC